MRVHGVLPPVFTPFLSLSTAFQLSGHPTCTFYRLGRAATSSARLYFEAYSFGKGESRVRPAAKQLQTAVVTIPVGFAMFPKEISWPPAAVIRKSCEDLVALSTRNPHL